MVVFNNFLPNKNEYRKYKIDASVKDDLGAMREVLYRRYYKVLMENLEKPDLIVLDGGKNQIIVCKEIINSLNLNIPIVGLVKDDHHKTNHLLNASLEEIPIPEDSNLFLYLSRIHLYTLPLYNQALSNVRTLFRLTQIQKVYNEITFYLSRYHILFSFNTLL